MQWKRTKCDSNACIEVLVNPPVLSLNDSVMIRSSRDPHQIIVVSTAEWVGFLDAVKKGEFDQ